jgi:hypothetical protein
MPVDFSGKGTRAAYEAEILDWGKQIAAASGGAFNLTDRQTGELVDAMEAGTIHGYVDFSKNVWDTKMPNDVRAQMPWLGLGVASDFGAGQAAWSKLVNSYSDAWHSMTGEYMNPVFDANGSGKGHDDFAKVYEAAANNESPDAFVTRHRADPGFAAAHPWVAQGMSWDQYQVHQVTSAVTLADAFKKLTGQTATSAQIKGWQDQFLTPASLTEHIQQDPELQKAMPFLAHGMDFQAAKQYRLETGVSMKADFFKATGQQAGDDFIGTHLDQFETPAQFQDFLHTNQQMLDTHGWLKLGLDYQGFVGEKEKLSTQFGRRVSSDEALTQLQTAHQFASGPTSGQAGAAPVKAGKPAGRTDESTVR